jgi:TonB family protein
MLINPKMSASFLLQGADFESKYVGRGILRGGSELFRLNAIGGPLPAYPPTVLRNVGTGTVVIELVVSAAGRVIDSQVIKTFAPAAGAAVSAALNQWRFHTETETIAAGILNHFPYCIRIEKLAFNCRIDGGIGPAPKRHSPEPIFLLRALSDDKALHPA